MKPLISETDYAALNKAAQLELTAGPYLADLLENSEKVQENMLPPRTVRLNSVVHLWHALLKKVVKFRIVLPDIADLKKRHISAFAPISLALFGRRENDSVTMAIGPVKKMLKIIKVVDPVLLTAKVKPL